MSTFFYDFFNDIIIAINKIIEYSSLDCIRFFFGILGDAMSNIVLTICCVLLLSILRQSTPNLTVNFKFLKALTLPALGGVLQRTAARIETEAPEIDNKHIHFEDALSGFFEYVSGSIKFGDWLEKYKTTTLLTIIPTTIAFVCICVAAFKIMGIRKKKHAVPMLGVMLLCLAIRFILTQPYNNFIKLLLPSVNNNLKILSYNLFIYGSIMLIAMIIYMYQSMQTENKLRTVLPRILYLLGFIIFYTAFNICANASKLDNPFILLITFILTFTFMTFCLIYGMKKPYKFIQQDVEWQNQYDKIRSEADSFNKRSKEMVKFEHDLSNNLRMIEETASKEKAFTTSGLVHSMLEDLYEAQSGFVSGNEFLNTILSTKKKEIEKSSTEISFEGIFPEKGIDNYDISTIMCNALDNAIEACMQTDEPSKITFVSKIVGDYVYFKISKPYKKIKADGKKSLITTKADNSYHGYGMKKIEETVKKYDGNLDITHERNTFTLSAKMRYQNSEA